MAGVCHLLHKEGIKYQVIAKNIKGSVVNDVGDYDNPNVHFESPITLGKLIKAFRASDLIWINTLYSFSFSVLPVLALLFVSKKKVLVSPRGQLLKGAMNTKKGLFLQVFELVLRLSRNKIWVHYSNLPEAQDSYTIFNRYPKVQFNNVISGQIAEQEIDTEPRTNFTLGYFGRVSPIKNIEFLLELLAGLPTDVCLEIHGSRTDEKYNKRLDELVNSLGISARVKFCGSYNRLTFAERLAKVDLVVISSISESFCHVFFEAIEYRKLVLASTGLPWAEANTRVDQTLLPLDLDLWKSRVLAIKSFDKQTYKAQQDKLVDYYKQVFLATNKDTLKGLKEILE